MSDLEEDLDKIGCFKGLKIVCWNVRSLAPKFAEIELTIEQISPDIICISESWLNETTPNSRLEIDGYSLFRYDRESNKNGGGLCIYGKHHLKLDPNCMSYLNVSNESIETQVVKLQLPNTKPITLVNSYRPPNGNLPQAIEHLQFVLDNLPAKGEHFILGDLNIDLLATKSASSQKLKLFEKTNKLHQIISSPTRITQKSSTLIDHIYTNSNLITHSGVLACNVSDHMPCFIVRKKIRDPYYTTSFKCRKIKHFDYSFYRNRLEELDWRPLYNCTDPNIAWDLFYNNVLSILDEYYPITEFNNVKVKSPWIKMNSMK